MEVWEVIAIITIAIMIAFGVARMWTARKPTNTIDDALPRDKAAPEFPGTRPRSIRPGTRVRMSDVRERRDDEYLQTSLVLGVAPAANSGDDNRRTEGAESRSDSYSSDDSGSSGGGSD